jgi:hypothetical protein
MSDVALTAAAIAAVRPLDPLTIIIPVIANEAVTAGQAAYLASTGKYGVADANASGKEQFRGIFLGAAAAGQQVDLFVRGYIYGFTISGLAYDALVYLSDTAGALADAAGSMTVRCGRVVPLTDSSLTKVLYIDALPGLITSWA